MAVNYPVSVKNARLQAVIDAIGATGVLEIGTTGMASVLATIPLANPAAPTPSGGVLTITMPRSDNSADAGGKAFAARIRTGSGGSDVITGLTVGLTLTVARLWVGSTACPVGEYRTNGANIYKCVTGGTTAASGGPQGTGSGIADGTVIWDYYCPAGADVQLDSLEISQGQQVTINSATITHAA